MNEVYFILNTPDFFYNDELHYIPYQVNKYINKDENAEDFGHYVGVYPGVTNFVNFINKDNGIGVDINNCTFNSWTKNNINLTVRVHSKLTTAILRGLVTTVFIRNVENERYNKYYFLKNYEYKNNNVFKVDLELDVLNLTLFKNEDNNILISKIIPKKKHNNNYFYTPSPSILKEIERVDFFSYLYEKNNNVDKYYLPMLCAFMLSEDYQGDYSFALGGGCRVILTPATETGYSHIKRLVKSAGVNKLKKLCVIPWGGCFLDKELHPCVLNSSYEVTEQQLTHPLIWDMVFKVDETQPITELNAEWLKIGNNLILMNKVKKIEIYLTLNPFMRVYSLDKVEDYEIGITIPLTFNNWDIFTSNNPNAEQILQNNRELRKAQHQYQQSMNGIRMVESVGSLVTSKGTKGWGSLISSVGDTVMAEKAYKTSVENERLEIENKKSQLTQIGETAVVELFNINNSMLAQAGYPKDWALKTRTPRYTYCGVIKEKRKSLENITKYNCCYNHMFSGEKLTATYKYVEGMCLTALNSSYNEEINNRLMKGVYFEKL